MSSEITEENAQGVLVSQLNNENSNPLEGSTDRMKNSSQVNQQIESMSISKQIQQSDLLVDNTLENIKTDDDIPSERKKLCKKTVGECVNESIIHRVNQLSISDDSCINPESTMKELTTAQEQLSESCKECLDSSEHETKITLLGLRLSDVGNDEDEFLESEEDSGSETDDFDSENGEETQMKKRKVQQEESWMSVLGVDKVSTELPQLSALDLNNKEEFTHMGNLECVIDKIVTIAGLPGMPAYDLDTLLFVEGGQKVLGYILDVMGPVSAPVYVVPMSSPEAIRDLQLQKGTKVYCAPKSKYTKYVLLQELMKIRGTDPSWTKDTETSEYRELSDEEQGEQRKDSKEDKKRKCSIERHRRFVKYMNRANERDTRLYKMADAHRSHLEQLAGVEYFSRHVRETRTRVLGSGGNKNSEGRRSRPLYRNNAQAVGVSETQNWSASNNASGITRNNLPAMPAFDPSIPPPNCHSSFFLPSDESSHTSFVSYYPTQNFPSSGLDFERSISRPNFRQNMPGPSNDSWFN